MSKYEFALGPRKGRCCHNYSDDLIIVCGFFCQFIN